MNYQFKTSELKNVEKLVEQTVQALKPCYNGTGNVHFCRNCEINLLVRRPWKSNVVLEKSLKSCQKMIVILCINPGPNTMKRQPCWCSKAMNWWLCCCSKAMKRWPCWCPKPVLRELNVFLCKKLSFVPINLHRCWPRERKRSIAFFILD